MEKAQENKLGVYPIPKIGQSNIAVGLGTMMVGFLMTLRWR